MASYRNTIKEGLLEYPSLFKQPFDVAAHLFLVVGNGYDWKDGELVASGGRLAQRDAERIDRARAKFAERIALYKERFPGMDMTVETEREMADYEFTVANIDRVVDYAHGPRGASLYPCAPGWAKLFVFPDDTKDDWLWGMFYFAADCLVMLGLRQAGENMSDSDRLHLVEIAKAKARVESMLAERGLLGKAG